MSDFIAFSLTGLPVDGLVKYTGRATVSTLTISLKADDDDDDERGGEERKKKKGKYANPRT